MGVPGLIGLDAAPRFSHAIDIVRSDYGDTVSAAAKGKNLRKWGSRAQVGTGVETLFTALGSETDEALPSTNAITTVVSTDADTQNVTVLEGHTLSGGNAVFYNLPSAGDSPFALNGTTPVTLPTSLFRSSRARLASPATGNIYFYEGGTRTAANTHLVIPAGEIQTQKASTTISYLDYWFITNATLSVLSKVAAWAQARIEIKPIDEDYFYPITQWVGAKDSSGTVDLISPDDPLLIAPKNHDVRMAVQANTSGVLVAGGMIGVLAKLIQS